MGPSKLRILRDGQNLLHRDWKSEIVELADHFLHPLVAFLPRVGLESRHLGTLGRDEVPEDVDFLVVDEGRHLDPRNQGQSDVSGCLARLLEPGDRVVIGNREVGNSGLGSELNQLGGRVLPITGSGV